MIKLAITNLGKYNEGHLVYDWLTLPYVDGELEELLEGIGINEEYEEFFISDYESELNIEIGEYENITRLNEFAQELEELDADLDIVNGIIENYTSDFSEILDILRFNDYSVLHNITSYYNLGYELAEMYYPDVLNGDMSQYIDFTEYGKDSDYMLIDNYKALLVY